MIFLFSPGDVPAPMLTLTPLIGFVISFLTRFLLFYFRYVLMCFLWPSHLGLFGFAFQPVERKRKNPFVCQKIVQQFVRMVRFDSPSPHWSTGPKITAQVMDYLKEIAPGCDFIAMNFNIRLTNRQMEVRFSINAPLSKSFMI